MSIEKSIFRNGSSTYYFSSKFFPKEVRLDVFKLYSFVRVADDYVDSTPQNVKEFKILKTLWQDAIDSKSFDTKHHASDSLNLRVVKNMAQLVDKFDFDPAWVDAFLDSMQADLDKKQYDSIDGSLWYVYGSAEVIGLMMAKIMHLPAEATQAAELQGRAMQWINFIRDIDEDIGLGRSYFPNDDLKQFGLPDLTKQTADENPKQFTAFVHYQLKRYHSWQREAEKGFKHIPKRLRIPLETAVDNYNWTARQIATNPTAVYDKKIKPSKYRIVKSGITKLRGMY